MLTRILCFAAVSAIALAAGGTASSADIPKKAWEKLRDEPVDYAPYERRRAENLKLGVKPLTQALAEGYAKPAETGSFPIVADPAVAKGLSLELQKLLQPEKLQLKLPLIEFVVVDDLGLTAELQAAGQKDEIIKAISDKEAANFFAQSTGGGAIVLGLSVLRTVKSYDELDFVVGHEAAHILYDHFTEDERKAKFGEYIAIAALIAGYATRGAGTDAKEAVGWSTLGLMVANSFLGPAWDRDQESESDALSYELMMELNRSEVGVQNVFQRFQARDDAFSAYLDAICGPDTAGVRWFKRLLGNILGIRIPEKGYNPSSPVCAARNDLFASLLKDHPETEDRKKDLEKHSTKFYPGRAKIPPFQIGDGTSTLLDFLSPHGEANRSVHAYDGLTAFHRGDKATARRLLLLDPLRGDDETLLPVLELSFYLANDEGKREQALHFLDLAASAPEHSLRFSIMAEEEYAKDKRWADAARIVRRRMAYKIAPPEETFPLYISYLRLAGKTAEMEQALTECKATGVVGLILACEATAHPPPGQEPGAAGTKSE